MKFAYALGMISLMCLGVMAQDKPARPAKGTPKVAVKARPKAEANETGAEAAFEKVVGEAAKYLASSPGYTVDVAVNWSMGDANGKNRFLLVRKAPVLFRVEAHPGDVKTAALITAGNGKTTTTYLPAKQLYSVHPLDLKDPFLKHNAMLSQAIEGSGIELLLNPHVEDYVSAHVGEIKDLGIKTFAKQKAHGFSMKWGARDVEAWIAAEGPPLLIGFKRISASPEIEGEDAPPPQILDAVLTWNVDDVPDNKAFSVTVPKDAKKVYDIYAELIRDDESQLVGKPAPKISVQTLDGTKIEFGGKNATHKPSVLILWATWCAPAVKQMAGVTKFVETYQAKGVRFVAVNVEEDAQTVHQFVEKFSPKSEIAIDADGHVVSALGVTHLPAVLVVGEDGIVKAVHEDVTAESLKELAADLDKLSPSK